ncbi:beta strand repeat-containing protein [Parasediminibacterium sp. JCM 36343]|uniref:beta strand repeat-containing protein n=1 Tax=Parasediminibacterium sp. JCM 36343 TaxID=3374279 RepID=UPI00397A77DC
MRKYIFILVILFCSIIFNERVFATNYYVKPTGSNSYTGKSPATPYATIQKAHDVSLAGDTIFIMAGTYSTYNSAGDIVTVSRSGTASAYIVYTKYPGDNPIINPSSWNGFKITYGASYIVIDGLTVMGNNANLTLSGALAQPGGCASVGATPNSGSRTGTYNTNGIYCDGSQTGGITHHIIIKNCEVYNCASGGISTKQSDYITIDGNKVHDNCLYGAYAGSGISNLNNLNWDTNTTDYKIIVRNNIVYNNEMLEPWYGYNCQITDGNGIIFDSNNNSSISMPAYTGKSLCENNIVYNNGGRGVNCFQSANVTVLNNTCFQNCKSASIATDGDITVRTTDNINVYNNIIFARTGRPATVLSGSTNFSSSNNLMYNSAQNGFGGLYNVLANPAFTDTANKIFTLLSNSPAINSGSSISGQFSTYDITNQARPLGASPDMGAYEYATGSAPQFMPGNLVALRANTQSATTGTVSLVEYTPTGTATGYMATMPSSTSGNRLTLTGTGSFEGQLSLSLDGRYLTFTGYDTAVGTTNDAAGAWGATKVIARVGYDGSVDISTRVPAATAFNGVPVRSLASKDGSGFWVASSTSSLRYVAFGATAATTQITGAAYRSVGVFNNGLFACSNGVVAFSSYPTTSSTPTSLGFTPSSNNGTSFIMLDTDPTIGYGTTGYDVLYVTDASSTNTGTGIYKYYCNNAGTAWVLANLYDPSGTGATAYTAITGTVNALGQPVLYAIQGGTANNTIISIIDKAGRTANMASGTTTVTSLASAGSTATFKGIAFAPTTHTWKGTTSTDWNTGSNWSVGTVPNDATTASVYLPYGATQLMPNQPVIGAGTTAAVYHLCVANGAAATIGSAAILTVSKNISSNASITGAGTLGLQGITAQGISGGGSYTNIALNNAAGATIGSGTGNMASIYGRLTLTAGTLTTNGNLTLKSTAMGDASIAAIPAANTTPLAGNITVERYIPAKAARKQSFIGSPISQSIRNGWQQQIYITGAGTGGQTCGSTTGNGGTTDKYNSNGFDKTITNKASMYTYALSGSGASWVAVPNTGSTNLTPGIGYAINIRGDRNSEAVTCDNQLNQTYPAAPQAVTLSTSGTVTTGNLSVTLNDPAIHLYTLLANPYPCPISFTAFKASNSAAINNKMWTYSPSYSNGNYTTYSNGIITNGTNAGYNNTTGDYIASGQAFFVEANTGGSVSFQESHKINTAIPNTRFFGTTVNKMVRVALKDTGNTVLDEVAIRFNSNGSDSYTQSWDAVSLSGGSQTLATLKQSKRLAIATRADYKGNDTAMLDIRSSTAGAFHLTFNDFEGLDSTVSIVLRDKFLSISQDIRVNNTYAFNCTGDTNSMGSHRFELVFESKPTLLPIKYISMVAALVDGLAKISWAVLGEKDIVVYEVEKSTDGISFQSIGKVNSQNYGLANYKWIDSSLANGSNYYRIKATSNNGTVNYSNVAMVSNTSSSFVSVYPNPVVGRKISLVLKNIMPGTYDLGMYNNLGQKVYQEQINYSGNGICQLVTPGKLPSGTYSLVLRHTSTAQVVNSAMLIVKQE